MHRGAPVDSEETVLIDEPTSMPTPGRCGARLRGSRRGSFCDLPPVRGKTRCRMHGARAGPPTGPRNGRWRDGARAKRATPLNKEELGLIQQLREQPPGYLVDAIASIKFMLARAVWSRNDDATARHASALGSLVRASVAAGDQKPYLPIGSEVLDRIVDAMVDALEAEVPDRDSLIRISERLQAIDFKALDGTSSILAVGSGSRTQMTPQQHGEATT